MTALVAVLRWFATSRLGRGLAAAGAIAFAIGIALLRAFSAGKDAERARQDRASLENLRMRQETDDEVRNLPASDVRRRLDEWVPDDEQR